MTDCDGGVEPHVSATSVEDQAHCRVIHEMVVFCVLCACDLCCVLAGVAVEDK